MKWSSANSFIRIMENFPVLKGGGYSILRGFNLGGTTELAIGHGVRCFEGQLKCFDIDISAEMDEVEQL